MYIFKKMLSLLCHDPTKYYYYTEPVDKRGSTTYPPEDYGPSNLVIYGTIILVLVLIVKCIFKYHKMK